MKSAQHKGFTFRRKANDSQSEGFTLVELLVVVAIIALLATVGIVMFSSAQKIGRMNKRIQDLKAIQTALEVYYSANKAYPTTSDTWRSECASAGSHAASDVIPGFTPTYMNSFPADPQMNATASTACYRYRSDGIDYKLTIYNVAEISTTDLQNNKNYWDPFHPSHPQVCGTTDGARRLAIYSSGFRCV